MTWLDPARISIRVGDLGNTHLVGASKAEIYM